MSCDGKPEPGKAKGQGEPVWQQAKAKVGEGAAGQQAGPDPD
jgi:hypothetical protein